MADMTQEEKDKELYKASLPAFFMNEVETDKIILTLSVGAIGFYSALLTGQSIILTEIMYISMILATILYGVTTAMVIGVFAQNKIQLISIISNNGNAEENPKLTFLDQYKYKPFIGAIFFSIVFMLALTYNNIDKNEPTQGNQREESSSSSIAGLSHSNETERFNKIETTNANKSVIETKKAVIRKIVDINKTTPDNNSSDTNNTKEKYE